MSDFEGASVRWFQAVLVSVVLHAAILLFFFAPGCDREKGQEPAGPSEQVADSAAEASDSPASSVVSAVEPVTAPSASVTPVTPVVPVQPVTSAATRPSPVASSVTRPSSSADAEVPEIHVVKAGDTLTKIARLYGTPPEALAELNGKTLKAMNKLAVGQKIKLRK